MSLRGGGGAAVGRVWSHVQRRLGSAALQYTSYGVLSCLLRNQAPDVLLKCACGEQIHPYNIHTRYTLL